MITMVSTNLFDLKARRERMVSRGAESCLFETSMVGEEDRLLVCEGAARVSLIVTGIPMWT